MPALITFAAGMLATLAIVAVVLRDYQRRADDWERNYYAECKRHDRTQCRLLALQRERDAAALHLQALAATTQSATQQVHGHAPALHLGGDLRDRFSRN
jgi:hypothetical protein